jgi:hypothetical protein
VIEDYELMKPQSRSQENRKIKTKRKRKSSK